MIISFIIGIVLRLINILFVMFPSMTDITSGFTSALQTIFSFALQWNWLFPIREGLQLVGVLIYFELGIVLLLFFRWIAEMVRGK